MGEMVPGYCCNCRKPLGPVDWGSADFVFCKPCAKAREVYTPPSSRPSRDWDEGVARFSITFAVRRGT